MPRIIAISREPAYNAKGKVIGQLEHTDRVADTPPRAAAPLRTAQACARCRQTAPACQCHVQQPHAQAQEAQEDWRPLSILRLHESARPIEPEEDWRPLSILRLHESARPIEPEEDWRPLSILRRRVP